MTNVDIFIDELGKLPHDNGANLNWYFDTDYELGHIEILMRDKTRKPVKNLMRIVPFEKIMAEQDPRGLDEAEDAEFREVPKRGPLYGTKPGTLIIDEFVGSVSD